MAIALSQINAHDSHVFPVGFICSWKQLLWCNSLMEPAASCRMPTLLQSSSRWVLPPQWNEWVWLWCFSAWHNCSYNRWV